MSSYFAEGVFGIMMLLFFIVFYVALIGLSIFVMVLTIQFLRKGNIALDIWIRKNDDRPKAQPRPRTTGSYQPGGYPGGYPQPGRPGQPGQLQNGYPYGTQPPVNNRQNVPPVPPAPPVGQPPVNQPPFAGTPAGTGYQNPSQRQAPNQGWNANQGWQPQPQGNAPAAPVPPVVPAAPVVTPAAQEEIPVVPPAAPVPPAEAVNAPVVPDITVEIPAVPAETVSSDAPAAPVGTGAEIPAPELTLENAEEDQPGVQAAGEQAAVPSEKDYGVKMQENTDEVVKNAEDVPPAEQ